MGLLEFARQKKEQKEKERAAIQAQHDEIIEKILNSEMMISCVDAVCQYFSVGSNAFNWMCQHHDAGCQLEVNCEGFSLYVYNAGGSYFSPNITDYERTGVSFNSFGYQNLPIYAVNEFKTKFIQEVLNNSPHLEWNGSVFKINKSALKTW